MIHVKLLREKKIVGCKWVFAVKSKTDGTVERVEGQISCERFYTNPWNRLSRNICPCCQDKFHPGSFISCC